jgi:hypothetical protein
MNELSNNLRVFEFNGVPFVETPYRASTYVREDVFWRQFVVRCHGECEYPEEERIYGTYWTPSSVSLGCYGLVEDAMSRARDVALTGEFELDADSDAIGFSGRLVVICDRERRLVLAGEVTGSNGVEWSVPVSTDEEATAVTTEVSNLRAEASYEAGWDNYSTAKFLRHRADVLEGRLIHRVWWRPMREVFQTSLAHRTDQAKLPAALPAEA